MKDLRATAEQSGTDWKRVTEVGMGAPVTIADDGDLLREGTVLHVADDMLTIDVNGEAVTLKREQVKEIDISPSDENKTFEGIYQLEKDALKICLSVGNDGRPSEFAVKDKKYVLITMERAK